MKFRKKPIVNEAYQWFKVSEYKENIKRDVGYFRHPDISGKKVCEHCKKTMHEHGYIDTLEGGHNVCPGDWIITGIKGEIYPCKPDIFKQTYDEVTTFQEFNEGKFKDFQKKSLKDPETEEKPYPQGHNWEGLTPSQVNEGYNELAEVEDFLKEHPNLRGKLKHHYEIKADLGQGSNEGSLSFSSEHRCASLERIHETQLDKQRVRDAIDKLPKEVIGTDIKYIDASKLKEELGIRDKLFGMDIVVDNKLKDNEMKLSPIIKDKRVKFKASRCDGAWICVNCGEAVTPDPNCVNVHIDECKGLKLKCRLCNSICTKKGDRYICPKKHPHPDGDFSYLCGSKYCRCCQ